MVSFPPQIAARTHGEIALFAEPGPYEDQVSVVLTLVGTLAFMLKPPSRVQSTPAASVMDRRHSTAALLEGRWRAAATGDTQAPDAVSSLRAAVTAKLLDSDRVLNSEQTRLLTETIANEIMARACKDPEEFVRLVEAAPGTRWINAEDEVYWQSVELLYEDLFGSAPERADPRSILKRVSESQLVTAGNRIIRYGMGDGGIFACAFRIRSVDQLNERFATFFNEKDFDYWFNAPSTEAVWLRVPARTLEQVLQEEKQAIVAASLVVVEVEGGWTYARYCYWYWDSKSSAWQCHLFSRKGIVKGVLF